MSLVLGGSGSAPGVPGTPLSPPAGRKCLQRWCQRKNWVCGRFSGPTATSHPTVISVPSLRLQNSVLTWAPQCRSNPGPGPGPKFTGPGTPARKNCLPVAAETGQPATGATQTFHTLLHT